MKVPLSILLPLVVAVQAADAEPADFHAWAATPPMGWNSWDCFGTTVTEAQAREQAAYMAEHLLPFGWEYLVVDIQWYEPGAVGHGYRKGAELAMDANGRLLPASNRFPSSVEGAGFKPLADHVHGLGLKFGVHLMRGIPRLAVDRNLPVLGTQVHAQDIANKESICPWNPDMYGVDMSKPGAQAYYDSVFALFASWGVDYVKVDDIARPYHEHESEIEAIRRAIDNSGRPMVLSLSPGETALDAADHVAAHANLWRISDDFWDSWPELHEQFARLANWNPHRRIGAWPDADMLPFGILDLGRRSTRFTRDEHFTVMTLWSIARSPLMHGGDMTRMDDFTLSVLTNPEVLAVNQRSENNRPLFDREGLIGWTADVPGTADKYLALFNARDQVSLNPQRAVFTSGRLAPGGRTTSGPVELDVSGAVKLVLVVDDAGDGTEADHACWAEPRLVDDAGRETPLTAHPWVRASGGWGQVSTERAPSGRPMSVGGKAVAYGIGAHANSVVEYDLPAGVTRLRFVAALDDTVVEAKRGATIEMRVFVAMPGGDLEKAGLPVAVDLADLGLRGAVRVRDLWARRDLGERTLEFAPEIPWHGAGLYRLSAVPGNH